MFTWIKKHKVYTLSIVFFILALVFNQPESETNAVSMFLFFGSIICGFVGVILTAESDFKNYER